MRHFLLCCLCALAGIAMVQGVDDYSLQSGNVTESQKVVSRRKRYVVFPKGSSLQLVIELLPDVYDAPNEILVGPTIGLAWELPTEAKYFTSKIPKRGKRNTNKPKMLEANRQGVLVYCYTHFIPQSSIFKLGVTAGVAWMLPDDPNIFLSKKKHKKFKRSVYEKVESYIDAHEMNGEECILRALCESGQRTPSKKPFVQEILHRIFSLKTDTELDDIKYYEAHKSINANCTQLYPDCKFSLFSSL